MAASELDTLEKVAELQRQLHASECKRLELENNLLACSKSDQWKRRTARLKSYLNEVRERERTAQLRNQQLLEDFESFEAQVTALTASSDTWKQMKMEYEKQMERLLPVWKEKLKTKGMDKEKNMGQAAPSPPFKDASSFYVLVYEEDDITGDQNYVHLHLVILLSCLGSWMPSIIFSIKLLGVGLTIRLIQYNRSLENTVHCC